MKRDLYLHNTFALKTKQIRAYMLVQRPLGTLRSVFIWLDVPPLQDKVISSTLSQISLCHPIPLSRPIFLKECSITWNTTVLMDTNCKTSARMPGQAQVSQRAGAISALLRKAIGKWYPSQAGRWVSWTGFVIIHKATTVNWPKQRPWSQILGWLEPVLAEGNLVHRDWSALDRFRWQGPPSDGWRKLKSQLQ